MRYAELRHLRRHAAGRRHLYYDFLSFSRGLPLRPHIAATPRDDMPCRYYALYATPAY